MAIATNSKLSPGPEARGASAVTNNAIGVGQAVASAEGPPIANAAPIIQKGN